MMDQKPEIFTPKTFLYFFLLFLVFSASIFPITDNDTWLHLKIGEQIFTSHAIPRTDVFSYTLLGQPWIHHEWLSALVFFLLYAKAGIVGLTLFKAGAAMLIFGILLMSLRRDDDILTMVLLGVAFLGMRNVLVERPQLFTYLLSAVYLALFRSRSRPWLIVLPLLQILWANLHGAASFIGIGITWIYLGTSVSIDRKRNLLIAAVTTAAVLVNPLGFGLVQYVLTFFSAGFNQLIQEYQPPPLALQAWPYYIMVILSLVSLLLPVRKDARDTAVIAISVVASVLAVRNVPLFLIFATPIIIDRLGQFLRRYAPRMLSVRSFLVSGCIGLVFAVTFSSAAWLMDVDREHRFSFGDRYRCRVAANFVYYSYLKGFKGRMFNDYDFGGYLIWRLYPLTRVFVDGRLLEYGASFIRDSFNYWQPEVWQKLEAQYDFKLAVIGQESFYNAEYLDSRPDWLLVYWDDDCLVYMKDVPENKFFIEKFGYRYLKPGSSWQGYLKEYPRQEVVREACRSFYFAPHSRKTKWLVNFVKGLPDTVPSAH